MGNTQTKKEPKTLRARLRQLFPFSWRDLGVSLSFLGLTAILCALLRMIDSSDVFVALIFECAVVLVSRFTDGYLFGLLASFLGVVGVNWIFTYPYMQLNFTISGYPLTFLIMLAVSVVVSALTTQIKQQEKLRAEAEKEKMRGNLLRAVSHDIRTPLTAIVGGIDTILENGEKLSPETRTSLLENMRDESNWLIGVVENLLSVTRMSGASNIKKELEAGEEVLSAAAMKFQRHYPATRVEISAPDTLLMIPMDIILDLGLPDMDGMTILRSVREWSKVPILVVSARSHERDKVEALDAGADDYLTKPFGTEELLARIRAAIRHTRTPDGAAAVANSGVFTAADLTIDYGKHRVYISGRDAGLTQNEYKLVALLGLHADKVLTYDYLIKELWGPSARSDNQILRVNMANIRRKIEKNPAQPAYIFTESGVGYRMIEGD